MTKKRRLLTAVLALLLTGTVLAAIATPAEAVRARVSINSVGARYVGASIPIVGYLDRAGSRHNKTLYLQRAVSGRWRYVARLTHRANGRFQFHSQRVFTPQRARWRVLVKRSGHVFGVGYLSVTVTRRPATPPSPTCASAPSPTTCKQPAPIVQHRDVTNPPVCDPAGGGTVTTEHQTRLQPYEWSTTDKKWEPGEPLEWKTDSTDARPATKEECPTPVKANPVLPDLVVLDLNSCSDAEDTNPDPNVDNCFRIVNVDERKLLKFPVVTANRGPGDMHIEATRSNSDSNDWQARQIVTMDDDTTTENFIPAMSFFFAGDGHSHWHIRDFDSYQLTNAAGVDVEGEKHGYCLEDNRRLPGVTSDPVFTHDVVCGVGDQSATTITHGLSVGWGDTYPSSLPDQAIDVTGLPDGVYTVRVRADGSGLIRESDNTNNAATAQINIVGDTVTPVAG
jgi:hypothetical protein